MAEKYPGWSPYNYTLQNPIKYIDPTGMVVEGAEWKPKLCDDGSTTYIKEDNDNESTLRKQYELTSKEAKSLYSKMDSNGEISGNSVKEVTGNEDGILKLKDFSEQTIIESLFFLNELIVCRSEPEIVSEGLLLIKLRHLSSKKWFILSNNKILKDCSLHTITIGEGFLLENKKIKKGSKPSETFLKPVF